MNQLVISKAEIPDDEPFHAQVDGRAISVYRIDGEYYAYANWCPHQGGPACEGTITGTTEGTYDPETQETSVEWVKDGEVIVCPWHTWEFDVKTGECLHSTKQKLRAYDVVESDEVIEIRL